MGNPAGPVNQALRDHVTRVGFQLTLTRPQVVFLVGAAEQGSPSAWMTAWFTVSNALRRKGLILHGDDDGVFGVQLTPAGKYVIGLLMESGIYQEITQQHKAAAS